MVIRRASAACTESTMRDGMLKLASVFSGAIARLRSAMTTPHCHQCEVAPKYGDKCDGCFENQIW